MGITAGVITAVVAAGSTAYSVNRSEEARSDQKQAERDAKREQREAAEKAKRERERAIQQEAMRRRRQAEAALRPSTGGGTILGGSALGAGQGATLLGG